MSSIISSPPPPTNEEENIATSAPTAATLTTLHPDIIHAHILSRLDGAALTAASASSSSIRRLCTADHLWRQICAATWPSLSDPIACDVISTFSSSGHRSIFSDAFPSLHHLPTKTNHHRPSSSQKPLPDHLISAVDIHYNGKPVFSRVQKTETQKNWFLSSSFWIDMVEPDEFIETPVKFTRAKEEWFKHLEENLTLSWIIIDPKVKRAVNLSSRLPVSVRRHWLTRELEIVYSVAMMDDDESWVRCVVKVTCCGKVGGEVHVREVRLAMEDVEGGHVKGKEGVEIVRRAMECGVRSVRKVDGNYYKERNERFEIMVRERREARHRREKARDVVSTLMAFFAFLFLCWIAGVC